METTIAYWGYIGIMEKKMETTGIIGITDDTQADATPGCHAIADDSVRYDAIKQSADFQGKETVEPSCPVNVQFCMDESYPTPRRTGP